MNIAYTMAPGRGDVDLLLSKLAFELSSKGICCSGIVQVNTDRAEGPCDMDVNVLPDGPTLRISQSLGAASRGCRLDPSVLEDAVSRTETVLSNGADILIINKFGKHEAEGRGFRSVIGAAIAQDTPVLIGVNATNLPAFMEFVGDEVLQLTPNLPDVLHWCNEVTKQKLLALEPSKFPETEQLSRCS